MTFGCYDVTIINIFEIKVVVLVNYNSIWYIENTSGERNSVHTLYLKVSISIIFPRIILQKSFMIQYYWLNTDNCMNANHVLYHLF